MKTAIVVPAHIPLTEEWVEALKREADVASATVFIVDDSDGKLGDLPINWQVFGYEKQEAFLGNLYPEFAKLFHKGSACRVFGHLVAYAQGFDFVIGLDSDCVVPKGFVANHTHTLNKNFGGGWQNPIKGSGFYPRGYPYYMRDWKVVCNMGTWNKTLDLNGADRRVDEPTECVATEGIAVAPIPLSGMNFSITREALAGFLFLPNFDYGKDRFRRIDDIWGGYIFQKITQSLRNSVTYGWPIVTHETVVDAQADADEEAGMYLWEERFIWEVDTIFAMMFTEGKQKDYASAFKKFAEYCDSNSSILSKTIDSIKWWVKAWETYG